MGNFALLNDRTTESTLLLLLYPFCVSPQLRVLVTTHGSGAD
jgi:hypothetical protein